MCRIMRTICCLNIVRVSFVLATVLQATILAVCEEATTQSTAKAEDRKLEEGVNDNIAQSSVSNGYSSVVYHDSPKQRYLKSTQAEINPAGESTANFRTYHPKLENYLGSINPSLVHNLMKQQPQTFDAAKTLEEHQNVNYQQQQQKQPQVQQQYVNHNYRPKEEQKIEETVTKFLYPPKKYKSVEPGSQTVFNVGYSIGFGGSSSNDNKAHQSSLHSTTINNEEVVTGKPKQPFRIRVEGKNSYWKQLSPNVEMSQNVDDENQQTISTAGSLSSQTRNHQTKLVSLPTDGRNTFDHNRVLIHSSPFDISNAVEPFITTQPLALPLTFPVPVHDTILLPQTPQQPPAAPPPSSIQNLQTYINDIRVAQPLETKKPRAQFLDTKATGTGNFHTIQTSLLPEDPFYSNINSFYTPQADNFLLPSMQQVFVALGRDGQMVPAYLIPLTAMNQYSLPQPYVPQNYFPQAVSTTTSNKNEGKHYNEQSTAATEQQINPKPFKPSQLLHIETPVQHSQTQSVRQLPNDIFKYQLPHAPKSFLTLRPPAPEKQISQLSQPSGSSVSYQFLDQENKPKIKTVFQLRPVHFPLPVRPQRDLVNEQSMLNAILSQELYRKNSSPPRVSLVPQTIYGVKNYNN